MDVAVGDEITLRLSETQLQGSVRKIETYSDTTDVERVVTIKFGRSDTYEGSDWVPWKGYYIEEPADEWRLNVIEMNGTGGYRTVHHGHLPPTQVDH